jgi:hypothetical protein
MARPANDRRLEITFNPGAGGRQLIEEHRRRIGAPSQGEAMRDLLRRGLAAVQAEQQRPETQG